MPPPHNPTTHIQIITTPTPDLYHHIIRFHAAEARWNSTVFELSFTHPTYSTAYDENRNLLGVASIHAYVPANYWLGNVVVAVRARRRGLGSQLVSALLRHVEQQTFVSQHSVLPLYMLWPAARFSRASANLARLCHVLFALAPTNTSC